MRFSVVAEDGNRDGPVDGATLQEWIADRRVTPETVLEREGDGAKGPARMVPGLTFPTAPVSPTPTAAPVAPVASVGAYPYARPVDVPTSGTSSDGWWGLAAGIGGVICAFFFGIGGIILGGTAIRKGWEAKDDPSPALGWIAIILGALAIMIRFGFMASGRSAV